jgi:serine protease
LATSLLIALAWCGVAASPAYAAERGPARSTVVGAAAETEARVIVKFKADSALMRAQSVSGAQSAPQHAQALSARLGLNLTDGRAIASRLQLVKGTGLSSQELADRLAAQSDVEYAVVDGRKRALAAPNDPLYGTQTNGVTPATGQWYLQAPSATLVSALNAEKAWGITTGKKTIVVADLDTGVRFDHPDLSAKLYPGYDFIHDSGTANDGDGRDTDASDPGDNVTSADVGVVAGCTSSDIANSSWHGTETAGLIGAATNNTVGMASIGRDVMVLPLRVLGKCGGYDSDILAAMYYAGGLTNAKYSAGLPTNPNVARVINMSLGSAAACSPDYQDAVSQLVAAGVVVVVAAGNDGLKVGTPANCNGVIAVAGVRHSGTKVGYSDLGDAVTISAPAGNCVNETGTCLYPILTTSNTGTSAPVAAAAGGAKYTGGGSDASLGTSFSAPLVSGTVALMLSSNASLTPSQVTSALKSTARAFPITGAGTGVSACTAPTSLTDTATAQTKECYCTTTTCGAGLLDAGLAVAAVATLTANITVASTSVVAGTAVTLDGSSSTPAGSTTINGYQWAITSGSDIASITSSTTAATATLMPTAAGTVVVSLTVTDSAGNSNTTSTTLTVAAAPVVTPTPSSGGGGGAMQFGWLLGWLASVIGVWAVTPRQRRR